MTATSARSDHWQGRTWTTLQCTGGKKIGQHESWPVGL